MGLLLIRLRWGHAARVIDSTSCFGHPIVSGCQACTWILRDDKWHACRGQNQQPSAPDKHGELSYWLVSTGPGLSLEGRTNKHSNKVEIRGRKIASWRYDSMRVYGITATEKCQRKPLIDFDLRAELQTRVILNNQRMDHSKMLYRDCIIQCGKCTRWQPSQICSNLRLVSSHILLYPQQESGERD